MSEKQPLYYCWVPERQKCPWVYAQDAHIFGEASWALLVSLLEQSMHPRTCTAPPPPPHTFSLVLQEKSSSERQAVLQGSIYAMTPTSSFHGTQVEKTETPKDLGSLCNKDSLTFCDYVISAPKNLSIYTSDLQV